MIRIRTGSRLHFGLFSLPSELSEPWSNQEGERTLPRRQFGGVGLMIDRPGVELTAENAVSWSAHGPLSHRTLAFAKAYCDSVGIKDCFALRIESAAAEHAGLGTGTQLGLAVARAIAWLTHQPAHDAVTLAGHVGRGLRSALGVHGFDRGGLLIEGGKPTKSSGPSPLLLHYEFPQFWQILLITPRNVPSVHGSRETDAFVELARAVPDDRTTESLCRLVLLGILPALVERDLPAFGEALYDFNRRVGAMFQITQGALYTHPRIERIIKTIREFGITGVGQSSWGPTIFAVVPDDEVSLISNWLALKEEVAKDEMTFAYALNRGAIVSKET